MAKIIHHLTTTVDKGEVTINLNLTITINQDGSIQVKPEISDDKTLPKVEMIIPEFQMDQMINNFGSN